MVEIKDVELGDDLKELMVLHPDVHNLTDISTSTLQDNELYLITKTIGYREDQGKSGIFIEKIEHITDEWMEKNL